MSDADLSGVDLRGADLSGVDLRGADLRGANLRGADFKDIKNYSESHTIFQEIVRRQEVKTFTDKEWSCIGQICIHQLCWDSIKNRFGKTAMSVFQKLSKVGYNEWKNKYKEMLKASK